jgi:aryl-alcohol dehydrogenase-like predicted oxidoreductase
MHGIDNVANLTPEAASIALINRALEAGINPIDTNKCCARVRSSESSARRSKPTAGAAR